MKTIVSDKRCCVISIIFASCFYDAGYHRDIGNIKSLLLVEKE
jgi:hypothetical protein